MRYTREYILSLRPLTLLDRELEGFYEADAERWTRANPDLGLPYTLARSIELGEHQQSRRVGPPRRRPLMQRLLALLKRLVCSR